MSVSSQAVAPVPFVDDDALQAMVRRTPLPPLLAALALATGDLSLLRADLRPDPAQITLVHGGLSSEQRAEGRRVAVEALARLRDHGEKLVPATDTPAVRQAVEFMAGEAVSDDCLSLLLEELAVTGDDLRAPDWRPDAIDPERTLHVTVVGAGMSGLIAGHRLEQAGVPYVILEKNDDVGGTWFENQYPGCRVDVPNHLYSYSFVQRHDWPQHFSTQEVLLDYFRSCAEDLGVRRHIRFGTEVLHAAFDDDTRRWRVLVRTPGGGQETIETDVLVSAVGQLNRPNIPEFPGRERFAGPRFHSAEWDHEVDLAGKRVAVIGTGASGIQLIPEVAKQADELLVFQRTPNWFMPSPEYHADVPETAQWLLRNVPHYAQWYRFWLFWRLAEGALPAARVDPDWPADGRSVGPLNDALRGMLTGYLEGQFADAPELREQVVPQYPPLAKRMLLDNGTWASALKRDNVRLVSDSIREITRHGVTTADGHEHRVDAIVYATGFRASRFLTPMRVTGRGGVDLHANWEGRPRAYLGMTVPGFPNLFCLYGPNTNLVANGSIIFFSECEVRYMLGCIRLLLERRARALDCRRDVYDAYNQLVDEGNARMAWGASSVNSWYKNADGHITQNWPFTLLEFWQRTRSPNPMDFEFL